MMNQTKLLNSGTVHPGGGDRFFKNQNKSTNTPQKYMHAIPTVKGADEEI